MNSESHETNDQYQSILRFEEVYNDPYSRNEKFINAIIIDVQKTNASHILKIISEELPLEKFKLEHLKRVGKCQTTEKNDKNEISLPVLLCPESFTDQIPSRIKSLYNDSKVVEVCRFEPRSRKNWEEWGNLWPVKFKPKEIDRVRDIGLTNEELKDIDLNLSLLNEEIFLLKSGEYEMISAGLLIDPKTNTKLVKTSESFKSLILNKNDKFYKNPIWTPGMMLIDSLASKLCNNDGSISSDQYLCTGLDAYFEIEPDLQTSMAFVHSRIRRIYYLKSDPIQGALGSNYTLNDQKELNHRFRVFKILNAL